MPHYKDTANKLHFLDDGVDPSSIPEFPQDAVEITDAEAATINAPTSTQIKDGIKAQIVALEAAQYMGRGEREAWLALIVSQAVAQGYTEPQMYAANPFYKHAKDLNAQIVALRAQL